MPSIQHSSFVVGHGETKIIKAADCKTANGDSMVLDVMCDFLLDA